VIEPLLIEERQPKMLTEEEQQRWPSNMILMTERKQCVQEKGKMDKNPK